MADDFITIIAALIGAVVGSLGAKLLDESLKRRAEKASLRQSLINQYLSQLQYAIDSLWHRLGTLKGPGSHNINDKYYEASTLFSLACRISLLFQ